MNDTTDTYELDENKSLILAGNEINEESLKTYLDNYLTTWKNENFGTGSYQNNGNISIAANSSINISEYKEFGIYNFTDLGDLHLTAQHGLVVFTVSFTSNTAGIVNIINDTGYNITILYTALGRSYNENYRTIDIGESYSLSISANVSVSSYLVSWAPRYI